MSIIYKKNCENCGIFYEGFGKKFCSLSCAWIGRNLNITGFSLGVKYTKGKKFPERGGKNHYLFGKHLKKETRDKMSSKRILNGSSKEEKNPNWKGGITHIKHTIHTSPEYQKWRKQVFMRDWYTCLECKDKTGGNLEAHHIKPFNVIIKENNIKTLKDAINCQELWDIDNGMTLCIDCHKKTDTYGFKKIKQDFSIMALTPVLI